MLDSAESTLRMPVSDRDNREGPADAPITLVEYGDYECPVCGEAYPIVKQVQKELGNELHFVFRNFPISNAHPHAEQAAEAAESAGSQGKFWQMHDALYEHQDDLSTESLQQLAIEIGLDPTQLESDLASRKFSDRVKEDFMSGARSGVNGTPTFFINNVRYDGQWDYETLLKALKTAGKRTR